MTGEFMRQHPMIRRAVISALAVAAIAVGAWSVGASDASSIVFRAPEHPNLTPQAGETLHGPPPQVVDGQQWSVKTFTNEDGLTCASEIVPNDNGEGGTGSTCFAPESMFDSGPIRLYVGMRSHLSNRKAWSNIWLWGWVAPEVSALRIELANCARIPLTINQNRMFFRVFGTQQIQTKAFAQNLIAYRQDSSVVATKAIPTAGHTYGEAPPTRTLC
jgi:hypothetical protein